MNQILAVEPPNKNKKSNKSGVHSILIVFAIILMIFGIGVTTTGAYSYYREISNKSDEGTTGSSNSKPIIHGDALSLSIAAASVLAKVTRDAMMYELDKEYPQYDFKSHKGYPTKKHLENIEKYGILDNYRLSYKPVKEIIEKRQHEEVIKQ